LYRRNVIFREVKPSPIVVQLEEDEKKLVVQLPPKTKKVEPENEQEVHDGPDEEEGSESLEEEEETPPQTLRRSTGQRRKPNMYNYSPSDFICIFSLFANIDEPRTMKEAMEMEDKESWRLAMDEEMVALRKNDTWDLVPFPDGWKPIGCKWVFKKKIGLDGNVEKHKARLVAKGYSQVEGIDFGEIFSLVAKLTSIRFLLSVATTF
jgi:hypothetical protein